MKLYFKIALSILLLFATGFAVANAQDRQVAEAVKMIRSGNVAGAKVILSSFDKSKEYPATLYLGGLLCDTPNVALKKFQKIVNDYSSSVWADDAEWQIFQCYIVSDQLDKAEKTCKELEKKFSDSNYLTAAKDMLFSAGKYRKNIRNDIAGMTSSASNKAFAEPKYEGTVKANIKAESTKSVTTTKDAATETKRTATTTATEVKKQSANGKRWAIQVGSFLSIDVAREESERITKRYRMRNSIIEKEVNGTKLFAVVVGNYATKEAAEASRKTVEKACNCDTMVIRK